MTGENVAIEWYLARDGQQHGPLSESEMRAFVEMGHLRAHDLVWHAGFTEWRPAPDVFAILGPRTAPAPQAVPAAEKMAPAVSSAINEPPASQQQLSQLTPRPQVEALKPTRPTEQNYEAMKVGATTPDFATSSNAQPALHHPISHQHASQQNDLQSPDQLIGRALSEFDAVVGADRAAANRNAGYADDQRVRAPAPGQQAPHLQTAFNQSQPANEANPDWRRSEVTQAGPDRRMATAPSRAQVPSQQSLQDSGRSQGAGKSLRPVDFPAEAGPSRRRFGAAKMGAATAASLLVGIGIAAYVKRDELAAYLPAATQSTGKSDPSLSTPPFTTVGTDPDAIDGSFQRTAIWRHIKVEFPEWYAERVTETAKFAADNRGAPAVAKHLAEAVVALRRKHADQALTASPERLRFVAAAFLDNLQALSKQNVETCYGFISQGETYPAVLEMLQKPGSNEPLQKQVIAVFEAISDGRKSPQSYLPPRKSDYDALAAELTARGWSQDDLQTFSDPRALGRASPQQVCRMVQDWFAAQIAIKDPAAQLRLLVESLRPVVAG